MGDQQVSRLIKVDFLENRYVSEEGRIYRKSSHDFKDCTPSKPDTSRYLRIRAYCKIKDKMRSILLHRVIASVFLDMPFYNNLEVNHKNGNRLDNRASNLEYVTRKENMSHAFYTGLNTNTGIHNGRCLITEDDVIAIYQRLLSGESNTSIANDYAISTSNVASIKAKKCWGFLLKDYPDIPLKHKADKLPDCIVEAICKEVVKGKTSREVSEMYTDYNVKQHQVDDIRRCRGYKHITEKYFKI